MMEGFVEGVLGLVEHLSKSLGSGVLVNDVLIFLLFMGFVTFLFAVAAFRQTYNLKTPPGLERVNSIAGKVEKVEMNLNEFRIETVRNMELFRGDLGYIKQELSQVSSMLKVLSKGGTVKNLTDSQELPYKSANDQSWGNQDSDELPPNPMLDDDFKKKV